MFTNADSRNVPRTNALVPHRDRETRLPPLPLPLSSPPQSPSGHHPFTFDTCTVGDDELPSSALSAVVTPRCDNGSGDREQAQSAVSPANEQAVGPEAPLRSTVSERRGMPLSVTSSRCFSNGSYTTVGTRFLAVQISSYRAVRRTDVSRRAVRHCAVLRREHNARATWIFNSTANVARASLVL